MLPLMLLYTISSMCIGGGYIPSFNTCRGVRAAIFSIKDNPYKYSGYYCDSESEMYYCQARYYSTELMRFINRDTYDLSNRYAYCDGNPISKVDSNGHMSTSMLGERMGLLAGIFLSFIPGPLGAITSVLGQEAVTQGINNITGQDGINWKSLTPALILMGISSLLAVSSEITNLIRNAITKSSTEESKFIETITNLKMTPNKSAQRNLTNLKIRDQTAQFIRNGYVGYLQKMKVEVSTLPWKEFNLTPKKLEEKLIKKNIFNKQREVTTLTSGGIKEKIINLSKDGLEKTRLKEFTPLQKFMYSVLIENQSKELAEERAKEERFLIASAFGPPL